MKYAMILFALFILSACGEDKRENYTTLDEDGNTVMSKDSKEIMDDLIAEFETCRNNSTKNLLDCKHFTAKAICEFYEIDDFEDGASYVDYDKMHEMIWGKQGAWKVIGIASNQDDLKKAQEYANNGQATVAISNRDKYGHVAIILPGHLKPGRSWGLDVPNCASFFLVKSLKPFSDKPLNYAWSSNKDIILYTRMK